MLIKKILTFSLVATLLYCNAVAQSLSAPAAYLRVIYQLDYKLDSAVVIPKRVQMILRASNGISRFQSTGEYVVDSVYMSLKELSEQERLQKALDISARATTKNEFTYTIFKEPSKGMVSYHDFIISEDYQYQEKASIFNWKITPTTKNIAGHKSQQAYTTFGGRVWEAWFARDIPVSEGPYKFYGLPGLILQVRDTHDNYVFTTLCLDTNPLPFDAVADSKAPLSASFSASIISKAKFLHAKLNDELTFTDRMAAHGNHVPEIMRQNYLEKLKRRNNPLELR